MAPWVEMLKKYYPKDKVQASALYGTSGALAVVEALKRSGPDLRREKFVKAMREVKDLDGGPMACKLSFSADDHEGCKTGSVWGIRNGRIVVMGDAWKK
jgi:branched-chain amino acid transport system substrate-binding protein